MGGFAEDAVLDGTVTRDRSDLDFLVKAGSWEAIRRELQLAGFLRFECLLTGPAGEALAYKSTAGVCEIEVWLAEETAEGYAIVLPSHAPAGGHGFFRLRLPSDTFAFPRTPLGRMPVQTILPLALSLFRAASALTRGDAAKEATDVLVRDRLRRECLSDRPPDELAPAIAPLAST
jgi:hypothetical protein